MKFILARKVEMSQVFNEKGEVIPVTLVEAGPCYVTEIKEGAVQIGFIKKTKNIKKTEKGKEYKYLKEFRIVKEDKSSFPPFAAAQVIDASVFQEGDSLDVSGISKGKGFAGVVKRWNFRGRHSTRGTKHEERTPGSTGSSGSARVFKGLKMAGRMGSDKVTVKNLKIIKVDKDKNIIAIKGAVPGRKGALLKLYES